MINFELDKHSLNYRYERKFRSEFLTFDEIINYIDIHPALFSPIYQPRFVNNIYFDTHNFESLDDNITGNSNRYKVRIRWYGDLYQKIEKPILEIKIKSGTVGTKLSYPLDSFEYSGNLSALNFNQIFSNSNLPDEILLYVQNWLPSLVNSYYRIYFLSADEKFRITVDKDLIYGPVSSTMLPIKMIDYLDSAAILELKYNSQDDIEAHKISSFFPMRATKNSKYVTGLTLGLN